MNVPDRNTCESAYAGKPRGILANHRRRSSTFPIRSRFRSWTPVAARGRTLSSSPSGATRSRASTPWLGPSLKHLSVRRVEEELDLAYLVQAGAKKAAPDGLQPREAGDDNNDLSRLLTPNERLVIVERPCCQNCPMFDPALLRLN